MLTCSFLGAFQNLVKIKINIITQNYATSLNQLLQSLINAHYVGNHINILFNMDNGVGSATLHFIDSFDWSHEQKILRRSIVQGRLNLEVSESWYPASDVDCGLRAPSE